MITTTQRNPRIGNISDREVRAKTGFGWLEWQAKLDEWDADNRRLRTTITYLKEHYGLNQFWAQVVATHYMLERLRED